MATRLGRGMGNVLENRPNNEIDPRMIDYRENSPVGHQCCAVAFADRCLQFETNL